MSTSLASASDCPCEAAHAPVTAVEKTQALGRLGPIKEREAVVEQTTPGGEPSPATPKRQLVLGKRKPTGSVSTRSPSFEVTEPAPNVVTLKTMFGASP